MELPCLTRLTLRFVAAFNNDDHRGISETCLMVSFTVPLNIRTYLMVSVLFTSA